MNWTDDTLMAFVDGELDAAQRAALERALVGDAALQSRVAALRAQRQRVSAAYAAVLDEPVPDRLAGLLANAPAAPSAPVVDLGAVRAAREQRPAMPGWAQWGGMAASVVLGVLLGWQFGGTGSDAPLGVRDGRLVAGGAVDQALSTQLASVAGAPVAVQLSFVDRDGAYCRTFSTAALAGLACRRDGQWAVQTLAATAVAADGAMRQAATSLPREVLLAVDQRIAGEALDAARERQARDQGWRR
jgi:anti-sigma factor RsiW